MQWRTALGVGLSAAHRILIAASPNAAAISAVRSRVSARRQKPAGPAQRFGSPGFEQHNFGNAHSAFGGIHNGGQTRIESDHGFGSGGARFGGGGGFRGGGGGGGFHGGGGGRR